MEHSLTGQTQSVPFLPPIEEHQVLHIEPTEHDYDDTESMISHSSVDERTSLVRSGQLSFSYTMSMSKYQSTLGHDSPSSSVEVSDGGKETEIDTIHQASFMTDFQASLFLPSLLMSSYSTLRQSYEKMVHSMAQSTTKRSVYTSRSLAYSLIEKLSDDRGASFALTMFNILPALLGSALFTIPNAVAGGGYVTIPSFIVISLLADFTGLLLIDSMYEISPRSKQRKRTRLDYVEVAEAAFGRIGARLANFTLVFYLFAANVILVVLIGKGFYSMLSKYLGLSIKATMAIFSTLVLPTLFIRRLSHLAYLSLVSVLSIAIGGLATSIVFIVQSKSWTANFKSIPIIEWNGFTLALGVWAYTLIPHTIVPQVEACMRSPEKFNKAFHLSFGISTPAKIFFGIIGALTYGVSTDPLVTKNIVEYSYPISVFANAMVCVFAVLNFPLTAFVVFNCFDSITLGNKYVSLKKGGKYHSVWILLTRPFIVGIALGIGIVIPYFGLLVGIIGSLLGTIFVFIFPCTFHLKLKWKKLSKKRRVLEIVILFIGTAVGALGLYASIRGLYLAVTN